MKSECIRNLWSRSTVDVVLSYRQFIYVELGRFGILRNLAEQRRMSEYDDKNNPQRKRRTREHILEDLSENHLEHNVLLKGHVLRRPERDYGVDVTMFQRSHTGVKQADG